LSQYVATRTEGRLGVVVLDRPKAINALDFGMIAAITAALEGWRNDPEVTAILFEGNGPRGFCAGGDVRAARDLVLAGRKDEADAYFAAEYDLNGRISNYGKPVIALTHGAVMGGGIGIAGHAGFRIALPDARFAMPEAAIGFVTDTGVNAILAKAPEHRALAFLLSGLAVGAADALALGLTDCVIAADARERLLAGLVTAAEAPSVDTAIVALMQAEAIEAGEPELCLAADARAEVFALPRAGDMARALGPDDAPLGAALGRGSPTSLEAILLSHRTARSARDLDAVLALDRVFASYLCGLPDFAEGVRAVLVDKDNRPVWRPAAAGEVDMAALVALPGRAAISTS
jgi:enoyl-CoA hydratase